MQHREPVGEVLAGWEPSRVDALALQFSAVAIKEAHRVVGVVGVVGVAAPGGSGPKSTFSGPHAPAWAFFIRSATSVANSAGGLLSRNFWNSATAPAWSWEYL